MPVPTPIGRVHPNEPRAVMVRDPENQGVPHSAVFFGLSVYTDNKRETDYLLSRWSELMESLSIDIDDLIANMPEPEAQVT